MAVPTGYIKISLLLLLPPLFIGFLLGMAGLSQDIIPYPFNWIMTIYTIVSVTVGGLIVAYMIIAAVHG